MLMRKISLAIAAAAAMAPAFATAQNVGTEQLTSLSPSTGTISMADYAYGLTNLLLNFKGGASVDRSADLFISLDRNGETVAYVPASNIGLVTYDGVYADLWQIQFFQKPQYVCKAGGDYTVTIPEGYFLIGEDKTPNSEIILNYTIPVSGITIYPEPTENILELQDFVLTYGNAESIEVLPDTGLKIQMYDIYGNHESGDDNTDVDDDEEVEEPGQVIYDEDILPEFSADGNSLKIHADRKVTKGGTWRLIIPSGLIKINYPDGTSARNDELIYSYKIPNYSMGQPEVFPAEGPAVSFPGVITLTVDKGSTLGNVNQMGKSYIYSIDSEGNLGNKLATYIAAPKNSSYYKDPITGQPSAQYANTVFLVNQNGKDVEIYPAPGLYQLVTAEKLYAVKTPAGQSYISKLYYTYDIIEGAGFDMEFSPANGSAVTSLKEIKVKFPTAGELKLEYGLAWLKSDKASYVFYPAKDSDDPQTVKFYTDVPVTLPGSYTLTSATNSVTIDGDLVVVTANYVVSEETGVGCVQDVQLLPAVFDICNAQGMLIKRNANIDDLRALPAGIYIAGGKKFINR